MALKLLVTLIQQERWNGAGSGTISIQNQGPAIPNWSFNLKTAGFTINEFWQFDIVGTGNDVTIKGKSWNLNFPANAILTSGFAYTGTTAWSAESKTPGVTIDVEGDEPVPPQPGDVELDLSRGKNVFGYYSEWSIYQRQFTVEMIPAKQLTHVIYAFLLPNPSQADFDLLAHNYPFPPKPYTPPPAIPEGQLVYHDTAAGQENINKLRALKQQNPHLKVLISTGGWTLSWTLSKVAANPTLRRTFVSSFASFVVTNGFDGCDIDWEYPGKQGIGFNYIDENDPANFATLLKELKAELNRISPNKYILIVSAMGTNPIVIENYRQVEPYLDHILMMTYDYYGSFGDGGHLAGLHHGGDMDPAFNVTAAVQKSLSLFPANKLNLGLPLYGRGWAKIIPTDPKNPIYGKSVGGPGVSYSGDAGEPGLTSWRHLKPVINKNGLKEYFDSEANAYYVHNDITGETWSYDNEKSIALKTQYAIDQSMGGIMFWELSDDLRNDNRNSLIANAVNVINDNPANKGEKGDHGNDKGNTKGESLSGITVIIINNRDTDLVIKPGESLTVTIP